MDLFLAAYVTYQNKAAPVSKLNHDELVVAEISFGVSRPNRMMIPRNAMIIIVTIENGNVGVMYTSHFWSFLETASPCHLLFRGLEQKIMDSDPRTDSGGIPMIARYGMI